VSKCNRLREASQSFTRCRDSCLRFGWQRDLDARAQGRFRRGVTCFIFFPAIRRIAFATHCQSFHLHFVTSGSNASSTSFSPNFATSSSSCRGRTPRRGLTYLWKRNRPIPSNTRTVTINPAQTMTNSRLRTAMTNIQSRLLDPAGAAEYLRSSS
jgi:hypothetical protein